MEQHVRAAMAATAIAHHTGRRIAFIVDVSQNTRHCIGAMVTGKRVNGYDFSLSCHFNGNIPHIYHFADQRYVDLEPRGDGLYDGFDHGSKMPFVIRVADCEAEVRDGSDDGLHRYILPT
jgi:hypothetical protein